MAIDTKPRFVLVCVNYIIPYWIIVLYFMVPMITAMLGYNWNIPVILQMNKTLLVLFPTLVIMDIAFFIVEYL